MKDTTLILLGAGNSTRFGLDVKKQWLYSGDVPLWLSVAQKFESLDLFENIIIVSSSKEIAYMKNFADFEFVESGNDGNIYTDNFCLHQRARYPSQTG